jgi:hypothetical protein
MMNNDGFHPITNDWVMFSEMRREALVRWPMLNIALKIAHTRF